MALRVWCYNLLSVAWHSLAKLFVPAGTQDHTSKFEILILPVDNPLEFCQVTPRIFNFNFFRFLYHFILLTGLSLKKFSLLSVNPVCTWNCHIIFAFFNRLRVNPQVEALMNGNLFEFVIWTPEGMQWRLGCTVVLLLKKEWVWCLIN